MHQHDLKLTPCNWAQHRILSHPRHQIDGQGESQWLVVLVKLDMKKSKEDGITSDFALMFQARRKGLIRASQFARFQARAP